MIKKHIYPITILLLTVSLISVGFSSWISSGNLSTRFNANLDSGKTYTQNDFIYFASENSLRKSTDLFEYCDYGFIENEQIVFHDDFTVHITINVKNIRESKSIASFENNSTIIVNTNMQETGNLQIFTSPYMSINSLSVKCIDNLGNQASISEVIRTLENRIFTFNFQINNVPNNVSAYSVDLKYSFDLSSKINNQKFNSFKTAVGDYLYGETFFMDIGIEK